MNKTRQKIVSKKYAEKYHIVWIIKTTPLCKDKKYNINNITHGPY